MPRCGALSLLQKPLNHCERLGVEFRIGGCGCLGVKFRIGGHASAGFRVWGHVRWLWPPIAVDKIISAKIMLARGSTFGGSVVI